jgi:hypothetical protein
MISSKHSPLAAASPTGSAGSAPVASSTGASAPLLAPAEEASQLDVLASALTSGLAAAASAAAAADTPLEDFMRQAWSAYVDSRPGFREQLADAQLMQQIQELRSQGKVGAA